MNIIFQVKGGLGKVIASTAVVKGLKKKYPKSNLIVISSFPDVFISNPNVYKFYGFDEIKGIYSKYVHNKPNKIFLQDPYEHPDHFSQETHIIKTWFKLFNLTYNNESPEIHLLPSELEYYDASFSSAPLPVLALHCNGGPTMQTSQYSWPRDIPYSNVLDVIDHYKKTHTIVHIKHSGQANYPNTIPMVDSWRGVAVLLLMSQKRLLIDSFSQHLASALHLPSTVCWLVTKPKVFGYDIHNNIAANPYTKTPNYKDSAYLDFDFHEELHKLPYHELTDIFDSKKIINSLNK